jgi:haloacetate dehalogenase
MHAFPGFEQCRVEIHGVTYNLLLGGAGPALLLLHGYPQTHLCWRLVAPELARRFTIVCPDLKGYGDSDAPAPDPDSSNYSKRAIAAELVELMAVLGFPRFSIMGHDRGARVGYRLVLDHPERVGRMVMLDILPTCEQWDVADKGFCQRTYHWGFLARQGGLPEHLIGLDPDFYLDYTIRSWAGDMSAFTEDVMAEYRRCFRRKATIAAACAD